MNWKKTLVYGIGGLLMLAAISVVVGYFYLRTASFERFAIRQIEEKTNAATGARTEVGSLQLTLSTLTAHLSNITLHGTELPNQPALFHADRLTVSIKMMSLFHARYSLQELLLEHPIAHLQVGPDGRNNFPSPPPSQSHSTTTVFDLAIAHAQLTKGEIYYCDRQIPVEADLQGLESELHFVNLQTLYEGSISYQTGKLQYQEFNALPHAMKLAFSATPQQFVLKSAELTVGSSQAMIHGEVTNYSNPIASGDYEIRIHAQDFASFMSPNSAAGDVQLRGSLRYVSAASQPILNVLSVDGTVFSDLITSIAAGHRAQIRELKGSYQLRDGDLRISDLSIDTLGGRVSGRAFLRHVGSSPDVDVHAILTNLLIRDVQQTAGLQTPDTVALSGAITGNVDAGWRGSISNLKVRSDLAIKAAVTPSQGRGQNVPIDGLIHAGYDGSRQTLTLQNTRVALPSAVLTADGTVSRHSALTLQVAISDLRELAQLAASFQPSRISVPPLSGTGSLHATVTGSISRPAVAAQFNATALQVNGTRWNSLGLGVIADPSQLSVQNASLINADRGRADLSGNVRLSNWAYRNSDPFHAQFDLRQLPIADLLRLAQQNYPVAGDLSASGSIGGSYLDPQGSGSAQISHAVVYGEPVQVLSTKFHAQNGTVVSSLNAALPAGAISADLSYSPRSEGYQVQLSAPAITLQRLHSLQNKALIGVVTASASGKGTLSDPQLDASIRIPQLQVQHNSVAQLQADAHIAQHNANFNLASTISQTQIQARGHVALSGDYETEASIDTGTVPLDVLLATYAPNVPAGFKGQAELHATLRGPAKNRSQLEAHVVIPTFNASYNALQIGIRQTIHVDFTNSVITLQPADLVGTGTSVHIQGQFPLNSSSAPALTAQGDVDLRILRIVAPELESAGVLSLDLRSSGSTRGPAVTGQLQLKNVAMNTQDAPLGVEKLNGTINLANNRADIEDMSGQVGGGTATLGGSITYRPDVQFNLALQGKSVRLRYPQGLRSELDANLSFSGTPKASTLSGRVLVNSLAFTPEFDLATFANQFDSGNYVSQPGPVDNIKLGIAVQSQENLSATNSQISIAGQAALQIGGTAANPVITGRTNLFSGELFYRNVRYQLEKGIITFDDPNQTHPVMNVSVTTTIEQYNLTLGLRGPLDRLTTSYVSDPPLATADVINLVARGQTTQEQAASNQSADSMIASQVASQLGGSVQKLAGISSLQIDPTLGGSQNPSARVAIQQRVTKKFLFTFSTDVTQPGTETVEGDYQFNKRWSVGVQRDELGGVSIDGRYHTQY